MSNKTVRQVADVLLIAGALNWGSIAVTNGNLDLVEKISGSNQMLKTGIYGAVGVAGLYTAYDALFGGRFQ